MSAAAIVLSIFAFILGFLSVSNACVAGSLSGGMVVLLFFVGYAGATFIFASAYEAIFEHYRTKAAKEAAQEEPTK
jgi:uncharacterized membrane protein